MALPVRIGRLRLPVLCYVVSKSTVKDGDLTKAVAEAVAGGVTMVQLREPGMAAGELLDAARSLKPILRGKALLVINDRVDVAVAVEADGVQLPETGLPSRAGRAQVGKYAVVGRSVHDAEAALQATREGSDFVLAGTIYKSNSKPDAKPAGVALIKEINKDVSLPVVAIGGITAERVGDVIKAGAAGVAVISAISGADDVKAAAEALAQALKEAWAARPDEVPASA
ncbi:MAG TPA: thiamine phosphate synthase [Dehalococcoidia bacterium]|jgi:thiamine-phosphate pyrophosphorylase|nr:thiamine phosphate synthase [Dehalococcoidia bacterium]